MTTEAEKLATLLEIAPMYSPAPAYLSDAAALLRSQAQEIERLTVERDTAIYMLADWCVAIDRNGASWDEWDEHYKDAMYRPCPLRELLDKQIANIKTELGEV